MTRLEGIELWRQAFNILVTAITLLKDDISISLSVNESEMCINIIL